MVLPITFFRKRKASSDGLNIYCKTCHSARVRAWRKKNPERVKQMREKYKETAKKRQRFMDYGLSQEQYEELFNAQQGCCAICGLNNKRLVVDHCHKTGGVRGLLCHTCNVGIGMLGDDLGLIRSAVWYLEMTGYET